MEYTPMSSIQVKKIMLIGEIAAKTGFSRDTIRWYEKIGLIKLGRKTRTEGNYRQFDKKTLERLLFIKQLKHLGFTLKEVEERLMLAEYDALKCNVVKGLINQKLHLIEQKIKKLQQLQQKLSSVKNECNGDCRAVLEIKS